MVADRQASPFSWGDMHALEDVGMLIEEGAEVNARDERGATVMHYAAAVHDPDMLRLLIQRKGNVNAIELPSGKTVLMSAVGGLHPENVAVLLQHDADITKRDGMGATAMHYAAAGRHPAVLQLLIEAGGDVNAIEFVSGRTVLMSAVDGSQDDNVALLLNRRGADADTHADVNARDRNGATVMHHAAVQNTAILDMLMNHGGDVNAIEVPSGRSVLMSAVLGHHHVYSERNVAVLLRRGADVHARDAQGCTALHFAAKMTHARILQQLIAAGGCVDAVDHLGVSVLMGAVQGSYMQAIRLLLAEGADVYAVDALGRSVEQYISQSRFVIHRVAEEIRLMLRWASKKDWIGLVHAASTDASRGGKWRHE
jgi:serine/threonine-protein phosphatase 6 regulatory ankyrin repeat subunit B